MRIKRSKLSSCQLKKVITHFVVDINASKTSLLTGVNRNTVNRFYHIFRNVIYQKQMQLFKEKLDKTTVECDEAYFGGKRKRGVPGKHGRGTSKQPVFGIFERDGKVYTEIVDDCTKPTLQAIIRGRIDPRTIVVTDKWRGMMDSLMWSTMPITASTIPKPSPSDMASISMVLKTSGHLPNEDSISFPME